MVRPISLRLRNAKILARARATLARCDEEDRLQRATKFWGLKALHACREAFALDEKTNFRFMPESEQEQVRKWRKFIEAELRRISGDR